MTEPHYFTIPPPRLDPDSHFPNTDCQHDDLAHLFFAPEGERNWQRVEREHEARQICAECPFQIECALHGLEHEEHGIWGGLSEVDRRTFDGRGVLTNNHGRLPGPAKVVERLFRAGISPESVTTMLRRWKWRRREMTRGAA